MYLYAISDEFEHADTYVWDASMKLGRVRVNPQNDQSVRVALIIGYKETHHCIA